MLILKLNKILISLLLIVCIVFSLSAGAGAENEVVHLTYTNWYMVSGAAEGTGSYNWEKAIKMFNDQNPGIEVTVEYVTTGAYWNKLILGIVNNTEADIILLDNTMVNSYNDARPGGAFLPLDDYIKGYTLPDGTNLESDLIGGHAKSNGKIITLPFLNLYTPVTIYRKSVLKEAGIDPKMLTTWSGQLEAAKKLIRDLNGDGKIDRYGFAHPTSAQSVLTRWWTMNYLWTAGGGIFPEEEGPYTADRLIFNCDANVKALEYLVEINAVAAPKGDLDFLTGIESWFANGELALAQTALWGVRNLKAGMKPEGSFEDDLGFAPFPAYDLDGKVKEPISSMWGEALAISSRCKYPKEAFDFVAFVLSQEMQKLFTVKASPANKKILPWWREVYSIQGKYIDQVMQYETRICPDIPNWQEFEVILAQAFNSALIGAKTPKEALDWGQGELVKILNK